MAYSHGIATGHADLFAKLKTFLTTNAALVAANQNWEIIWDAANLTGEAPENVTDILLRGPGLAGQDQVYVGLRAVDQTAQDRFWIETRGATGPMSTARTYYDHIKSTPYPVRMFTDSGTMEYWFVANGRRFAVVLKISTVFECMYAGLFLPYASPLSYPYPLMLGGSAGPSGMSGSVTSWRHENDFHSAYTYPKRNTSGTGDVESNLWMLDPNGDWVPSDANPDNGIGLHPLNPGPDWFQGNMNNNLNTFNPRQIVSNMVDAYGGGGRLLTPYTLLRRLPYDQTYGIMDGIFACSGVANAAENIIQSDGADHLVVQNAFRTSFYDYFAMALE